MNILFAASECAPFSKSGGLADVDDEYRLVVQIHISGRGSGTMYVEMDKKGINVQPYTYDMADAKLTSSLKNLLGMAKGTINADKLFMNGQLKVEGSIARGHELRKLFHV